MVVLVITFLFVFSVSDYRDNVENKIYIYMLLPNYDLIQHYIYKFKKEKIKTELGFCRLYWYLLKVILIN